MKTRIAIKKPIPITVVQFDPEDPPEGKYLLLDPASELSRQWQVYNALHNSWVTFTLGDWLNVSDEGDIYPIEKSVFEQTYDLVSE